MGEDDRYIVYCQLCDLPMLLVGQSTSILSEFVKMSCRSCVKKYSVWLKPKDAADWRKDE